ncbi:FMN-binding protein [Clostridium sp. CM028]|uniref:FMN-binding protein n=1 Tax=unclassified Clostridium TaxID=2614128 RepID=UPI001C0C7041|nr:MULTISPECIES: FMN-binding protein [unclassified Clostridium]MBU3093327.1 FMN-binding protein [Clostridium sp. CF011]MBW9147266.1 FMN-binding protein [Clostridium sp. CM027]MBW9150438.1 FMN-binding protein [Clostridium sp. CM028]UVE41783.1 FMN-binding protein [Clostridium sp. CM027]WAG70783.1 FMN-binding protein [Clostridium sp. CF011]
MKKILKVTVSISILLFLIAIVGVLFVTRGLESGINLVVNDVNLSSLSDGMYNGKYNAGRWSNEMNIIIKEHKIIKIDVVKDVFFSKPEVTKALLSKVLEKQNTNVDVISGATVTSKAYLKAIENSLK